MDELWHKVMKKYFNTCVYPDCWLPAVGIHEEPPRSIEPRSEKTMCPLCEFHLSHIHDAGWRNGIESKFEEGKLKVLDFYMD